MRSKRLKVIDNDAYYHCMSRTVSGEEDTRVRFRERDKEVLRKMIRKVADFSGVNILSYCVMDNHFHVLVGVPRCAREIPDGELVGRYKVLYPRPRGYQTMSPEFLEELLVKGGEEAKVVRRILMRRMGDISE